VCVCFFVRERERVGVFVRAGESGRKRGRATDSPDMGFDTHTVCVCVCCVYVRLSLSREDLPTGKPLFSLSLSLFP